MKKRIAILGAGLAGLNCTRLLEGNFEVDLFEKSNQVGGRVFTSGNEGKILDRGFQVFLPGYPEAKEAFDIDALDLKPFNPGANIRLGNRFYTISDPMRRPQDFFSTVAAPIGTFLDKLLILKLKSFCQYPDSRLMNVSTKEFLSDFGFSQKIIDSFFVPFFSGVFLERELRTSAYFFQFIYRMFSISEACLPKEGMSALPKNLKSKIKQASIHLDSEVEVVNSNKLKVGSEEKVYDAIVYAFNPIQENYNLVTTDYFVTKNEFADDAFLYLNGESKGIINHVAPLSKVNENYSQKGETLLSVNLLSPHEDAEVDKVKKELEEWFPGKTFEHVERMKVKKSLPSFPHYGKKPLKNNGFFFCGDFMHEPSINGALKSGRLAAEAIQKELA